MAIQFDPQRWERIRRTYEQWWSGTLDRPVINIAVRRPKADRPASVLPFRSFTSDYPLDAPAEQVIDSWDYELSHLAFAGDAFPHVWVNFGPGVMAEFIGGRARVGDNTVWFGPARHVSIDRLNLEYRPHSTFLDRIRSLSAAAVQRWGGGVQVSMTDLGGNLDMLSTFLEPGPLAMELYDHPEHVDRLLWQVHELWFRYYQELNGLLQPVNPGYSTWCPILSDRPWYMLQCDFAYMISPEMFRRFVRPELSATCKRLGRAFYHLDGVGQLGHLDSLLEMPELAGIQWVPGAGQEDFRHWPDVYRRIRAAGKLIQTYAWPLDTLDVLADQLGSAKGICIVGEVGENQQDDLMRMLEHYGAV